MRAPRGSWPVLLVLIAAFVLTFYWQRSHSTFLRIEQERAAASLLADQHGVAVADVLALRDLVGLAADDAAWQRLVAQFAAEVAQLRRRVAAPKPASADAGGMADPIEVVAIRAIAPDPLAARRFQLLRERFAARR